MVPYKLTENVPRIVKIRLFAFLAHCVLKMHQLLAPKPLIQAAPTPEIDQNRSVFNNYVLIETAMQNKIDF